MKDENLIKDKSKAFAIRIVNLYKYLTLGAELALELMSEKHYEDKAMLISMQR